MKKNGFPLTIANGLGTLDTTFSSYLILLPGYNFIDFHEEFIMSVIKSILSDDNVG